jgi:uncharacterized protein HemX
MTVKVELTPEVEQRLSEHARVRGIELDAYVQKMIEDAAARLPNVPKIDRDGINAMLDELAEMGKDLPVIPLSALTREAMYSDHD